MAGDAAIGVDAGGTRVLGLVVDGQGAVLDRHEADMPALDAGAAVATVVEAALRLKAAHPDVIAVGVGAAGLVDLDGVMRFAPNLAWRNLPLRRDVQAAVGLPVTVDNDANVAAWGEARFGAARGRRNMLMVTVGTGIGGGIVTAGRLFRGAHGFGSEIGHIVVEPNGPRCGCGNLGCLEQVASGRAIDRLGREAAAEHPQSLLARLAGGDPASIAGPLVTRAARQGDPIATRVLAEVGHTLGVGIAGLVNVLDPEVVVVGGGATEAGDLLLAPARVAFEETLLARAYRPEVPILAAALGNDAGAVGAADQARLHALA